MRVVFPDSLHVYITAVNIGEWPSPGINDMHSADFDPHTGDSLPNSVSVTWLDAWDRGVVLTSSAGTASGGYVFIL